MSQPRKAIIPAAGLGTRFLPASKTVPKEMFPIIDKPILLYVIEDAVRAGIEDIVLIAGRHKTAIEDFFDASYELEDILQRSGKTDWYESLVKIRSSANIISLRQQKALGLGHAVWCGRSVIGDQPFAVLLADEIMINAPNEMSVVQQLVQTWNAHGLSTVAIMPVADSEVSKYGILEGTNLSAKDIKATRLVEKPTPSETKSRWALPGRYVFDPSLFSILQSTSKGKNGEIQLTDAMNQLCQRQGLIGHLFSSRRYDAGDKFGYVQAQIELGLEHPETRDRLKKYLAEISLGGL